VNKQERKDLIKKAMSELGKLSAKSNKRDKQYYTDLVNKRWKKKKAISGQPLEKVKLGD
jgi:hypothetical protein